MFIITIYKNWPGAGDKRGPFCALKTQKCGPIYITSIISTVKWSISAIMDHFLDHLSVNSASPSAFSAWKNRYQGFHAESTETFAEGAEKFRARSPHVSKGSSRGLLKLADEQSRYLLSWIDPKLEPLLTCGLRTRTRGILIRRDFLYSI